MTEWQPIETAPTNVEILGWDGFDHGVFVWRQYMIRNGTGYWCAKYDHEDRYGYPTHWMRLPAPPIVSMAIAESDHERTNRAG